MEDFQIIDNCLMVRMPEEVDHHRASYICRRGGQALGQGKRGKCSV